MRDAEITGYVSDTVVRASLAEIASRISPVQDNDGRMAYASLLLGWVLRGETGENRLARFKSIQRVASNHERDAWRDRAPGQDAGTTVSWPDFQEQAEKILEFIGGGS